MALLIQKLQAYGDNKMLDLSFQVKMKKYQEDLGKMKGMDLQKDAIQKLS
jgi:hypothetical protein